MLHVMLNGVLHRKLQRLQMMLHGKLKRLHAMLHVMLSTRESVPKLDKTKQRPEKETCSKQG